MLSEPSSQSFIAESCFMCFLPGVPEEPGDPEAQCARGPPIRPLPTSMSFRSIGGKSVCTCQNTGRLLRQMPASQQPGNGNRGGYLGNPLAGSFADRICGLCGA